MNIADRLGLLKYKTDRQPHITIDKTRCAYLECSKPCINSCPAGCYSLVKNKVHFQYEDCIECGTCKIVCPYDAVEWNYPRGTFGVAFKYG